MRPAILTEHRCSPDVALSHAELARLREILPSLRVVPSARGEGLYDLTPDSTIGAIQLEELSILIRPKLPISRVLFLVSYALDPRGWREWGFDFEEEHSLVEAIVLGFVAQLARAFRRGLLQGYRTEESSSRVLRGRLMIDEQIRRRFGIAPPAEIRFDDFTEDIEPNRLIKAAIARLGRLPLRSRAARMALCRFEGLLCRVSLVDYPPARIPEVRFDRLNAHYRGAVTLARLILRSSAFEHSPGSVRAGAFLLDMNQVFEDFVAVALREALGLSERVFPQNLRGRSLHLDDALRIRLEPDLSWWEASAPVFVGDVKYKRLAAPGILHPDIYQLLAYATAAGLPAGLLVYAAGESDPGVHHVPQAAKDLHVCTLDLAAAPEGLLHEVGTLAARIRRLHSLGTTSSRSHRMTPERLPWSSEHQAGA